ncbi:MAG: hypothetical protein H6625_07560 [Bdellovibrionaceae bacterium]|nr:hypothetical protein [Pseudobdellovibrionaceae bacterium]
MNYILRSLLLLWFTLSLAQCGETTDSDKDLKIYLAPQKPDVHLVPITVTTNGGETKLTPPWFKFQMKAENFTGETLYILGLTFIVNFTKNGEIQPPIERIYQPSDFSDADGNPLTEFIAQVSDKGFFEPKIFFYIDSLPDAATGGADSFVYSITGIIEGFTGTTYNPNRNIRKRFNFTTKQPSY